MPAILLKILLFSLNSFWGYSSFYLKKKIVDRKHIPFRINPLLFNFDLFIFTHYFILHFTFFVCVALYASSFSFYTLNTRTILLSSSFLIVSVVFPFGFEYFIVFFLFVRFGSLLLRLRPHFIVSFALFRFDFGFVLIISFNISFRVRFFISLKFPTTRFFFLLFRVPLFLL